jgi:hypothetical protein
MTTLQFNGHGLVMNVNVNGEGLYTHGTRMPAVSGRVSATCHPAGSGLRVRERD